AVLARVAVGADLARVLQRRARGGGGQPVHLQHAGLVAAADRGRRRQALGREVAQPARAADAELAVALVVALAVGDRVQVVPDAQQVRGVAGLDEGGQAGVGVGGGGDDAGRVVATGERAFVHLDHAERERAVRGPGDVAVAAAAHRAAGAPDLVRGRAAVRLQR